MPFDAGSLSDPDAVAAAVALPDASFAARLAFGLRNKPRAGQTSWIVLEIRDGTATAAGTAAMPSAEAPEESLGVVLGIAAAEGIWSAVGDQPGFLQAVADHKFFVTGEAPYFIRHLEPILSVWGSVRQL